MKAWGFLLVLVVWVSAGGVLAQCSDGEDEVCIFWTSDCVDCVNCGFAVGVPVTAHIVLLNPSHPSGVIGFEFMLVNGDGSWFPPSNVQVLGYNIPPDAIIVTTPPVLVVGLDVAIPWSPCITLVTVDLTATNDDPWCIGLGPPPEGSLPTSMGYAANTDPILILPLYPCTGDSGFSIACQNDPDCPPPVGSEKSTWGTLKGLFR